MFVFYVIPIALMIAFVVGVALRAWTLTLPPVIFAQATPPYVAGIVISFLEGVSETRFGFPSGIFRVDQANSQPDERVTVREIQPTHSVTDGCAATSTVFGMGFLSEADGCLEVCLGLIVIFFVIAPIWILNFTEKGFRKLLQSEVRADLEPITDPDGTMVTIRLRGISAILLRSAYEEALSEPKLPSDIAIAAGVQPAPEETPHGE